jgi:hypothetical protein
MTKEREATCLASWPAAAISVRWQCVWRGCVCSCGSGGAIPLMERQFGACFADWLSTF